MIRQVRAITPLSIEMVDQTVAAISDGWSGMSPAEQEAFLTIYDPADTGEINEQFVGTVLSNYQRIRQSLDNEIKVKYEPDDGRCEGMQLYYTDIISLHICPYFLIETNDTRRARTLIHEFAHIALRVTDRPYYRPTSKSYAELMRKGIRGNATARYWAGHPGDSGPATRCIIQMPTPTSPWLHRARPAPGRCLLTTASAI